MPSVKPWYQSKTVWATAITALLAAYGAAAPYYHLPLPPDAVLAVLSALGLYGRVAATQKIG